MSKTMSKRQIFLSDVVITALEGGIGYWSQASKYRSGYSRDVLDEKARKPASAVIHEVNEDESGYSEQALTVDTKLVAKAFQKIMSEDEIRYTSKVWRKRMVAAYWDVEDGVCDIDAGDADCIVQIGLFGEVRYG